MKWTNLSDAEIERRRQESIAALNCRDRMDFDKWYQKLCDETYWKFGRCCAGCDFWASDMGGVGKCTAGPMVSGQDVIKSMGMTFCSLDPGPGFISTKMEQHCGKFQDEFDWSALDAKYLEDIGAMRDGKLKAKPTHPHYSNMK